MSTSKAASQGTLTSEESSLDLTYLLPSPPCDPILLKSKGQSLVNHFFILPQIE